MKSAFTNARFFDEAEAFRALEAIMWPDGPVCPHCGAVDRLGKLESQRTKASKKNPEGKIIHGLWKCYHCKGKFTVRVDTIFEDSHVELRLWFQAAFLMCSSKKGVSANQLHRTLGVTLKTAWFMSHRLREAMAPASLGPMGGEGKIVEADATYWGPKEKNKHKAKRDPKNIGGAGKQIVHTLIERGGQARSHHVPSVNGQTVRPILMAHVDRKSTLMTDEHGGYVRAGKAFASHQTVDHGRDEYVRGDAYTNTAEGFFSIFKRGMTGIYQHCSEKHLHRYLAEFDFRYNHRVALGVNDDARTHAVLKGAAGKRLTYGGPDSAAS